MLSLLVQPIGRLRNKRLLGVKGAGTALADDLGFLGGEDGHQGFLFSNDW